MSAEVKPYPVPVARWPNGEAALLLRSWGGYAMPLLVAEIVEAQPERASEPDGPARVQTWETFYRVRERAADINATLNRLKAEGAP